MKGIKDFITENDNITLVESEEKWALVDALYYEVGKYTSKIKQLAEEAYRKATDVDEKRIIDNVWDDASHIELLLSDSETCIKSGTVCSSDYKAIEHGSNTYWRKK